MNIIVRQYITSVRIIPRGGMAATVVVSNPGTASGSGTETHAYVYEAVGGEHSFTATELIDRVVLLAISRGLPLKVITAGTPTDLQVLIDASTGNVTFNSDAPFTAGDLTFLLYK